MKKLHVRLTFTEPVLGTWPANANVAREFIASKSPDAATIADEVAALGADAVADKGMTIFPRDAEGRPVFYDYQILRTPAGCFPAWAERPRRGRRRP